MKLFELNKKNSGAFIGWKFNQESINRICNYLHLCKFQYPAKPSSLHITVLYSRNNCPNLIPHGKFNSLIPIDIHKLDLFEPNENNQNMVVLRLKNIQLVNRNIQLMHKYKVVSDFGTYKPHVTLAYKINKNFNLNDLPHVKNIGRLFVNEEYFNPLNNNFNPEAKKKTYD